MTPIQALKADTYRIFGKTGWRLTAIAFLKNRTFRVILSARLCQAMNNKGGFSRRLLLPILQMFHLFTTQLAGLDFSWRTKVGAGLAITHGWGLVVNPHATIGSNVTLFHGVTLGRKDSLTPGGGGEFPIGEDEVWIGPHAIIVGGVVIGRGSRIAGGSFVTESIPPRSIVVGNPARIVKSDCVPDCMNRISL